jgi:hypothetical protein
MKRIRYSAASITVGALAITVIIIAIAAAFIAPESGSRNSGGKKPALTFPSISEVPMRDDVKVTYSNKTDEQFYVLDGIELICSFISYPVIEGGNSDATHKINEAITEFASERVTIKSYEKTNAEDAYKRSENEPTGFIEFEFITRVESVYVKNGYLSVMFRRVRTVGISEPKEDITSICFDLLSGEAVDASSFMNVDEAYAEGFIIDVFTQHIKLNPKQYYNDALQTLPDILDLNQF